MDKKDEKQKTWTFDRIVVCAGLAVVGVFAVFAGISIVSWVANNWKSWSGVKVVLWSLTAIAVVLLLKYPPAFFRSPLWSKLGDKLSPVASAFFVCLMIAAVVVPACSGVSGGGCRSSKYVDC